MAADGTQMDTFIDNLLAETSIRYGGFGGIAYHHISDQYIALFSRFIPCGVWEAVYIIDGLLKNASEMKSETIHADTQGHLVTWTPCLSLRGKGGRPSRRTRRWRRRPCGYEKARRTARSVSSCSTRAANRSRWSPASCGSSQPGTARRTRWSPMRTISGTCGSSSLAAV
ncbi:Tn3 family transposase [Streptomyces sp. GC420]|nr:Tn3 family transposase [Streptomyces sp. GC420]